MANNAEITIGANLSPLERGLRAAQAKLQSWGAGLMRIGGTVELAGYAMVGGLLAATYQFSQMGSEMQDMSMRTGVAVDALSGLVYAAEQGGASGEDLEKAFKGMSSVISDAAAGIPVATKKLADLGLSIQDFQGLNPDEAFELLAERISQVQNPMQRAAIAADLFGKSGMKMLPMMADGAEGIRRLRAEAERMGVSMSGPDAAATESLGDQISLLAKQFKYLVFHIGAAVAPLASDFLKAASETIGMVIQWTKNNRELIVTVFKIGLGVALVGGAIAKLGLAMWLLGAAFGVVNYIVGVLWSGALLVASIATTAYSAVVTAASFVMGLFTGATWLSIAALAAFAVAFVAVVAAGALLVFLWDDVVAAWLPVLDELGTVFSDVWGGIVNAVKGGELKLAFQILWAGIKLLFVQSTNFLAGAWFDFKYLFIATFGEAINDVIAGFESAINMMIGMINDLVMKLPETMRTTLGIESLANVSIGRVSTGRAAAIERNALRQGAALLETEARTELNSLTAVAMDAAERARRERLQRPGGAPPPMALPDGISSFGTFSSTAASGFGVSPMGRLINVAERQEKIQDDMRALLDRLANRDGGVEAV